MLSPRTRFTDPELPGCGTGRNSRLRMYLRDYGLFARWIPDLGLVTLLKGNSIRDRIRDNARVIPARGIANNY